MVTQVGSPVFIHGLATQSARFEVWGEMDYIEKQEKRSCRYRGYNDTCCCCCCCFCNQSLIQVSEQGQALNLKRGDVVAAEDAGRLGVAVAGGKFELW